MATTVVLAGCVTPPADEGALGGASVAYDAISFETEVGTFVAILFCDATPATCEFMRGLVEGGYYDGRAFGRVMPGFVIQEVDRTGGTTDQSEKVAPEFGTNVAFSAGALGIARDADPNSGGSEFFVMDHPSSNLWGNYTAFAQVVDGMDVVHAIARAPAVKTGPVGGVVGAPPGSPVYFGVHDRVPVDPVQMTRVTMTTVELPADVASQYPLVTSDTVRSDARRATLEWPRDVAAGKGSLFTWYAWGRDVTTQGQLQDPPPLDYSAFTIEIEGEPFAGEMTVDETNGMLSFLWTPRAAGLWHVALVEDGEEIALANVTVAR